MTERTWLQVFAWPIALAAITCVGLVAALLGGDGVWRWLSWVALAIPIAAVVRRPAA
jgi:hypothetical protein